MDYLHFLPQWYLEKKKIRRIKLLKILIIIFFTIDLVLVDILMLNKNKISVMDNEIKEKILCRKNIYDDKNKSHEKKLKTLNSFLIFFENISKDVNLQNFYIENKNINIEFNLQATDYMVLIKSIENNNKLNIKSLYIPYSHDEGAKGKIGLEVK